MRQAYHDASTDDDREAGRSKHKKHKKEKKRKRAADKLPANGSKKHKKVPPAEQWHADELHGRPGMQTCAAFDGLAMSKPRASIAAQRKSALGAAAVTADANDHVVRHQVKSAKQRKEHKKERKASASNSDDGDDVDSDSASAGGDGGGMERRLERARAAAQAARDVLHYHPETRRDLRQVG